MSKNTDSGGRISVFVKDNFPFIYIIFKILYIEYAYKQTNSIRVTVFFWLNYFSAFFTSHTNIDMNKIYSSTARYILVAILCALSSIPLKAQTTCTPNNPSICSALTPLTNPFVGASGNATQQSISSRLISVTGSDGCLFVSFTQGGTAIVNITSVTIITAAGEVTCTNVPVTNGKVCMKICDPRITQGSEIRVRLDFFFSSNTPPMSNVIVDLFAVISASDIAQTTCTPTNPAICATLTPLTNPFVGASGNATQQSISSRLISVTGSDGCVFVSFTQGGIAIVNITSITIITASGDVTCTDVPVTNGKVCMKICDPRFTQGSDVRVRLNFLFASNTPPNSTVAVDLFAVDSADVILPLRLIDFRAAFTGGVVKLNWTTVQEENVSHFDIMRSDDGMNYFKINRVNAKGGALNTNYELIDARGIKNKIFYRLKMVDIDGAVKFSPIVTIRRNSKNEPVIVLSPNPVRSAINLKMSDFAADTYTIEMRNSIGQLVFNKIIQIKDLEHSETINRTTTMSKGLYVLSIYNKMATTRNVIRLVME